MHIRTTAGLLSLIVGLMATVPSGAALAGATVRSANAPMESQARFDWGTPFSGVTADYATGNALMGGGQLTVTNVYVTGGSGMMIPWQVGDRVDVILLQASGTCTRIPTRAKSIATVTVRTVESRSIPRVVFTIPTKLRVTPGAMAVWSVTIKTRPYNLRDEEYAPKRIRITPAADVGSSRLCSG